MEITEIGLLTVKKEATYGTDPVPTMAANTLPVVRDQLTYEALSTPVERKLLDGSLDTLNGFNSLPNVKLKFRCEVRGNRTDGVAADISSGSGSHAIEIDPLLQAANLIPAYTAETSLHRDGYVTYTPAVQTGAGPSVTCYWYTQLKLHKLVGGKVNIAAITWEAGKPVYIDFEVMGKYVAVTDNTFNPASAVFLAVKPPVFAGTNVSLGAYSTAVLNQIKVELGNKIVLRKSGVDTDGVAGFLITGFAPKGTLDPETVTEATNSFWADWYSATTRNLQIGTLGSVAGNQFFAAFNLQYKKLDYAARDAVRTQNINFDIVKTSLTDTSGSQFSLKFS
jgi:hypothetical protein